MHAGGGGEGSGSVAKGCHLSLSLPEERAQHCGRETHLLTSSQAWLWLLLLFLLIFCEKR